jgi:hypothetical protein
MTLRYLRTTSELSLNRSRTSQPPLSEHTTTSFFARGCCTINSSVNALSDLD